MRQFLKAGFCRILKSRILKDVGFQWNPTDIPTNSNGFHRIPTDPNGFHRKKYEKVGKCWKKSEIYDPTFYDPTLAFSEKRKNKKICQNHFLSKPLEPNVRYLSGGV